MFPTPPAAIHFSTQPLYTSQSNFDQYFLASCTLPPLQTFSNFPCQCVLLLLPLPVTASLFLFESSQCPFLPPLCKDARLTSTFCISMVWSCHFPYFRSTPSPPFLNFSLGPRRYYAPHSPLLGFCRPSLRNFRHFAPK